MAKRRRLNKGMIEAANEALDDALATENWGRLGAAEFMIALAPPGAKAMSRPRWEGSLQDLAEGLTDEDRAILKARTDRLQRPAASAWLRSLNL